MLSIIVPVYNVFQYLDRCLESIQLQSCKNFEVILINDGSTDGSDKKCLQWAGRDERIRYFSQKNQGLGPTRNLGLKLSRYDYITFIDADDWWSLDYIEKMMAAIIKYSADIAACDINYVQIDAFGKEHILESQLRFPKDCAVNIQKEPDLLNRIRTFLCGKIYKKTLFLNNELMQPPHTFEDIPITPVLTVLAKQVCRVGEPLYYYYKNRKDSLSNDSKNFRDILFSLEELKTGFQQRNLFQIYYKQLMKLTFSQIRFIARKSSQQSLVKQLLCFMNQNYSDWADISESRFGIIGSRLMGNAVSKLVLYDTQIVFLKTALECLGNTGDLGSVDYMIVDGLSLVHACCKAGEENNEIDIRLLEECIKRAKKVYFVKTYPTDMNRSYLDKQYLHLLGSRSTVNVVCLNDYDADNEESNSWNIADALFMEFNRSIEEP